MNPLARQLNAVIKAGNPHLLPMLSAIGKRLFFPKGILSQSAEAKEKAKNLNATIGIATQDHRPMILPAVADTICRLDAGAALTYAPSFGLMPLRRRWREDLIAKNPLLAGKVFSLPVVTSGITHGVATAAEIWVDPGEAVILPEMMWGNYNMILDVRRGATIRHYPFFNASGGFNVKAFADVVAQEAAASPKVTVLLNFPHNPSGYTVTTTEAAQIADVLAQTARQGTLVVAICDDSYFGLFYEEQTYKQSLFTLLCDRNERLLAIKLDGATKENFAWGLRVGFITYGIPLTGDPGAVYDALERKTAGCIRGTISNAANLSQAMVLNAFADPGYQGQKAEKAAILEKRAKTVKRVLADPKYEAVWDAYPFNSGYFMCLRLKTVAAEKLRVHLLDHYGIGLVALGERNLRVAFSCLEEDEIPLLFEQVWQAVKDLETAC
jgi:aspartate/methionine/tyrosine aminotransferase